jgi:hypothetical protein
MSGENGLMTALPSEYSQYMVFRSSFAQSPIQGRQAGHGADFREFSEMGNRIGPQLAQLKRRRTSRAHYDRF